MRKHYNPERRNWKGRSYRKGGELIQEFKHKENRREQISQQAD